MIVSTKSSDALLKGIVSTDALVILRIDSVIESIQLDPNISTPKKELFIVTNDDLKNIKIRREFAEAVMNKHPDCVILYISKNGKEYPEIDVRLFDKYLAKPKKDDVRSALQELVEAAEAKAQFKAREDIVQPDKITVSGPKFDGSIEDPDSFKVKTITEEEAEELARKRAEELANISNSKYNPPIPEDENNNDNLVNSSIDLELPSDEGVKQNNEVKDDELSLCDRIRNADRWAALRSISESLTANNIVREVANANASYKQTESYLLALQENITSILISNDIDNLDKLKKIRAILCDRTTLMAKNNSLIEQAVDNIITELIDKAVEIVGKMTDDINSRVIGSISRKLSNDAPNVRLSSLMEERAKTLMELNTLDLELKKVCSNADDAINDITSNIISSAEIGTGSAILDNQIKIKYGTIVPENYLSVIEKLASNGIEVNKSFGELSNKVLSITNKMMYLLSLYNEENEVLGDTIRYMKANHIEDTIVAETILKKSSRLFVTDNDFDSIAISYIISKYQSRRNENVLVIDLTNSDTLSQFNIELLKYSDFISTDEVTIDKFKIYSVFGDSGVSITSTSEFERLSSRLIHFSKHYSRINIICTAEQVDLIDFFKNDVLSITYLIDCLPKTINKMNDVINRFNVRNTANSVILVNYLSDSAEICRQLGIIERLDFSLSTINNIPELKYCALRHQDPFDVDSICESCKEVLSKC